MESCVIIYSPQVHCSGSKIYFIGREVLTCSGLALANSAIFKLKMCSLYYIHLVHVCVCARGCLLMSGLYVTSVAVQIRLQQRKDTVFTSVFYCPDLYLFRIFSQLIGLSVGLGQRQGLQVFSATGLSATSSLRSSFIIILLVVLALLLFTIACLSIVCFF